MAPFTTVIVPTYNRRDLLSHAIASVRAQTLDDWELIVVDDGSNDGTTEWLLSVDEPRMRVIRRQHTGCIAAVRNEALDAAHGSWTAFLDSDDRWHPTKLAAQRECLAQNADASWCHGRYTLVNADGIAVPEAAGIWRPFAGWIVDRLLTTEAAVVIPTLLVRTDLARTLRFDERLPLAEDYDFVLRLAAGARGCVVDDVIATVTVHRTRTTSLAGPFTGHLGKAMAYRKAAHSLTDATLRSVARRQMRSHLQVIARRSIRHRAPREFFRAIRALRQL